MKTKKQFAVLIVCVLLTMLGTGALSASGPEGAQLPSVSTEAGAAGAAMPRSTAALASVYYVDQSYPGASDDNDGSSESSPWLTIQKAADTVDPGDTVYVKTGVYDERVFINRDGTSTAKDRLQGFAPTLGSGVAWL